MTRRVGTPLVSALGDGAELVAGVPEALTVEATVAVTLAVASAVADAVASVVPGVGSGELAQALNDARQRLKTPT